MDITEITLVTGERYEIQGSLEEIEHKIISASRGSIMQLAWLAERTNGASLGVNPACIVSLRPVTANPGAPPV